jgi:uncharacterized protein YceH (UPF0502 family)
MFSVIAEVATSSQYDHVTRTLRLHHFAGCESTEHTMEAVLNLLSGGFTLKLDTEDIACRPGKRDC